MKRVGWKCRAALYYATAAAANVLVLGVGAYVAHLGWNLAG